MAQVKRYPYRFKKVLPGETDPRTGVVEIAEEGHLVSYLQTEILDSNGLSTEIEERPGYSWELQLSLQGTILTSSTTLNSLKLADNDYILAEIVYFKNYPYRLKELLPGETKVHSGVIGIAEAGYLTFYLQSEILGADGLRSKIEVRPGYSWELQLSLRGVILSKSASLDPLVLAEDYILVEIIYTKDEEKQKPKRPWWQFWGK